jgi:hypothetical protein
MSEALTATPALVYSPIVPVAFKNKHVRARHGNRDRIA